jgi:hypothetical protein
MKEFKVGESSQWLFHNRHSDAWCSAADYISGPRGLQIGYAYDFTYPFFCGAFQYNWQHLNFINKVKGHPHDTPVQAQRGGGGGQHYAPAALPRYPHWQADTVVLHVEFYEFETWSVTSKHIWMVCRVSTLRKTLANKRKVIGGLKSLSEALFRLYCCLFLERQPPVGQGLLIHEVSRSHTTTHHSR